MTEYLIWTDGGARGNPGPAGIGVYIQAEVGEGGEPRTVAELSEYIGTATNNQAEYRALLAALAELNQRITADNETPLNASVQLFTDSELMAYQIQGRYRVKNAELQPLYQQARDILATYGRFTITPVRREKNQVADRLVNQAIDAATK